MPCPQRHLAILATIFLFACGEKPESDTKRDDDPASANQTGVLSDGGETESGTSGGGTDGASTGSDAGVNSAPVAQVGELRVLPRGVVTGVVSASDADGDKLTFAITQEPAKGKLTSWSETTGAFTYTAADDASGEDSFVVAVSDGEANVSVTAKVTLVDTDPTGYWKGQATRTDVSCSPASLGFRIRSYATWLYVSETQLECDNAFGGISIKERGLALMVASGELFSGGVKVGTINQDEFEVSNACPGDGTCFRFSMKRAAQLGSYSVLLEETQEGSGNLVYRTKATVAKIEPSSPFPAALVKTPGTTAINFGGQYVGDTAEKTFSLHNEGEQEAIGLTASALTAPFAYKGGTYPGAGGTCGTSLRPGETCTVVLQFAPTVAGSASAVVNLEYTSAESGAKVTRPLAVMGSTVVYDPKFSCADGSPVAELHLVGIYEARSDHFGGAHPTGSVTVTVDTGACTALVVSAYEPVNWIVNVAAGTEVVRVLTNGFYTQTVTGVDASKVDSWPYDAVRGTNRDPGYPYSSATPNFVDVAQNAMGILYTSFQGGYLKTTFSIQ